VRREPPISAPLLPPSFVREFPASSCEILLMLLEGKGGFQRRAVARDRSVTSWIARTLTVGEHPEGFYPSCHNKDCRSATSWSARDRCHPLRGTKRVSAMRPRPATHLRTASGAVTGSAPNPEPDRRSPQSAAVSRSSNIEQGPVLKSPRIPAPRSAPHVSCSGWCYSSSRSGSCLGPPAWT
jgi:hypothetical protein